MNYYMKKSFPRKPAQRDTILRHCTEKAPQSVTVSYAAAVLLLRQFHCHGQLAAVSVTLLRTFECCLSYFDAAVGCCLS